MTTHVNKVHHVTTISQVAKDLGEDENWLRDLIELIRFYKENPCSGGDPAAYAEWIPSTSAFR